MNPFTQKFWSEVWDGAITAFVIFCVLIVLACLVGIGVWLTQLGFRCLIIFALLAVASFALNLLGKAVNTILK